ncbi:hypothetical protein VB620_15975 [Nodularia harveyana UHCC-0300]|uniref:Uncharacterized protein n=1 Tax=Nodularia harveyana UHCC-0300 TaxID=2974287 RepID=A0ABU5UGZ5_9CYAN|nr:hypothetical protein [Nodularia harveyana]MEA5582833.1 hypothetical protein [Nodularia harveyana UHCC-0300]
MFDLYELISNIRKRPAMYLGETSISNLRTFLAGYCFARRQMGISQTAQEKHFSQFQSWIQHKINRTSNQTWDQIILSFSRDQQTALAIFFDLFDEFIQTENIDEIKSNPQNNQKVVSRIQE